MERTPPTATVKVLDIHHCRLLQEHGWAIAAVEAGLVGWKRVHELTDKDRETFTIEED